MRLSYHVDRSTRTILAVAALVGSVTRSSAQARTIPAAASIARMAPAIDSITETFRQEYSFPGITIAVATTAGDVIYENGYGFADRATRRAATSRTPFRIYSISKVFAAVVTHQLVEAGQLSLSAPIGRYLTDLPAWRDTVVVRQLIAHTSGIEDYTDMPGYEASASAGRSEDNHFVALALQRPLLFPSGSQWRYSNTGYALLQRIMERVTGDAFPATLSKRVLAPADLAATSPECRLDRIATGYTAAWRLGLPGDSVVASQNRNAHRYNVAAGGLCSTAPDVARFMARLVGGRIVNSASLADMIARIPVDSRSGAGLFVQEDSEGLILRHSGGGGNGNAEAMAFPRDSLVLVALTNSGGADFERLIRDLRRQILGLPQPVVLDLPMTRDEWAPLLGTYVNATSGERVAVVVDRAGQPFAFGGRLLKQADGSYVSQGYRDWRLTFRRSSGGTVELTITAFGVVIQRGQRRP